MVGYRGRYEYLGKTSARLDDLVNVIPARLAAAMLWLSTVVLPGLAPGRAGRIMFAHRGRTESPNAGWTMAAMAGGLGVTLEKVGHYSLGDPAPEPLPAHNWNRHARAVRHHRPHRRRGDRAGLDQMDFLAVV